MVIHNELLKFIKAGQLGFNSWQGHIFLHRCVQTSSGAQPTSYPVGSGCSFPGVKVAGAWSRLLTSI